MEEETVEILNTTTRTNTNTSTTNNNKNNNRFSLQLRYPFLKSFMANAVNSVNSWTLRRQKRCKLQLNAIYTAQIRINSDETFSETVTTKEELLILSGEGVGENNIGNLYYKIL